MLDTRAYLIPTYHSTHLLRGAGHYHDAVVADLQRAARIAEQDHWEQTANIYKLLPGGNGNCSVDWCVQWVRKNMAEMNAVSVDTETYGMGNRSALDQYTCKLHAIGISFCPSNEALSWLADGTLGREATRKMDEVFRELMANDKITKIFHNGSYDREVLLRHGYQELKKFQDTLILSHLSDPEQDHGLGPLTSYLLDVDPWKVEYRQLEKKGLNTLERLLHYNGRDALATQQICPLLMNRVIEVEQQHIAQLELTMSEIASRMGRVGIPIDEEKRKHIEIQLLTKRDEALQYIKQEISWADFDPRKPKHRYELVYGRMKLPVKFYTKKKGEPSTGRRALLAHLNNPVVRALVQFDENAKLLSTFVAKLPFLVDDGGRLHPHWNSTGTKGSRWSSSDPNFQNWRKWLREIVTTKPGRVLVGADSAAIEYRIIVCLAGCKKLLDAFNDPTRDIHSEVAATVFGEAFTSLEKKSKAWTDLRNMAKRVVYARNYRAQPGTICENLKQDPQTPMSIRAVLTPAYIERISRNFDKEYPEIGRWCEAEWDKANRTGRQEIVPIGRVWYHSVLPVEPTKAANIPVQFAAGDFHNISLQKVDEELENNFKDCHAVLTVHDQIVAECRNEDAEAVGKVLERHMTHVIEGPAGPVTLFAQADINPSWHKV